MTPIEKGVSSDEEDDRLSSLHSRTIVAFLAVCAFGQSLTPYRDMQDMPKALRAYPVAMPRDISFEAVVKSQPFPAMKYPVPIIGWKEHPEEVHVTPNGALVFPRPGVPRGLYLTPFLGDAPFSLEKVNRHLVDGYMPGIESEWSVSDLRVRQLAFCTLLGSDTVKTGREPLVAFTRYRVENPSKKSRTVRLWLNFGEAVMGQSMASVPPPYLRTLRFQRPFVMEPEDTVAACVLSHGRVGFRPLSLPTRTDDSRYTTINVHGEAMGPDVPIDVVREGGAVRVGRWRSERGFDVHMEASMGHSVPVAAEVDIVSPGGEMIHLGTLYRGGLSETKRGEFIKAGEHSAPIPWSLLASVLPQGPSKIVVRGRYPVGNAVAPVGSWESTFYVTEPGVPPNFKRPLRGDKTENSLFVDLPLPPSGSATVDIAIPYFPLARSAAAKLASLNLDHELRRFRRYWEKELNRNAEFIVPEKRIRDSVRACLANNLILTDHDPKTGLLLMHPDATAYESVWAGDSGVILQAMDRMGYHAEAASWARFFLRYQGTRRPDGASKSVDGFYTGNAGPRWMCENGFILWALSEHYKLTRDARWLRTVAPSMIKGCDWIVRERAATKGDPDARHYGLLPKGAPSDIGVWDYWYWTDTYSYMGLRGAADALADIGMASEANRLRTEAEDYKTCIRRSVERSIVREVSPPFIPPSPYTNQPPTFDRLASWWYSICSPIYMVEAGLLSKSEPWTADIEYWLERYGLYSGLCAFGGGLVDPHYVYNQSLVQLLRGETDKFLWTFYSLFAYGQSRDTYATIEGMNLLTGSNGDDWAANRQPHMHSNSRVLDMVRIALVLEEGDMLHLMAGTPRAWQASGKVIEVRKAPTYFGDVGFRSVSYGKRVRVTIQPPTLRAAKLVVHIRPPSTVGPIRSVTVNGRPWKQFQDEKVMLGARRSKTTVVCRF